MEFYLAEVNIARMLAPLDSPVMADFVANLDPINELAEKSEGFIWRLKDDTNNATSIKVFDDDFIIVNQSVWRDIDTLSQYVYKSHHADFFKRRKEWFEKMPEMHMAMWYVPANKQPTVEEAMDRVVYLRKHGETPYAFSFRKKFTAEEASRYVRL